MGIKIYWKDSTERTPLTLYHPLKLFCVNTPENQEIIQGKRPHVTEFYDEIVFNHPSQALKKLVTSRLPSIPDKLVAITPSKLPLVEDEPSEKDTASEMKPPSTISDDKSSDSVPLSRRKRSCTRDGKGDEKTSPAPPTPKSSKKSKATPPPPVDLKLEMVPLETDVPLTEP